MHVVDILERDKVVIGGSESRLLRYRKCYCMLPHLSLVDNTLLRLSTNVPCTLVLGNVGTLR